MMRSIRAKTAAKLLAGLLICCLFSLTAIGAPAGKTVGEFAYILEKPGEVSAAVYDEKGRLVRTLLRARKQEAGEHLLRWDGLDRHGRPRTGDHTVRVLRKPPLWAEFVMQIGVNPGSEPYHKWVGNHNGAASVAVDSTGMYVACQITEGPPVLLKQSLDGKKRLWTKYRGDVTYGRYQGGISLASDGDRLYMLQQNGFIQLIDAETGEYIGPGRPRRGNVPGNKRTAWDIMPPGKLRKGEGGKTLFPYRHGKTVAAVDLAVDNETIVVSYRDRDAVRWLESDGDMVVEVEVPAPNGIAVGRDNGVYVISEKRILRVWPGGESEAIVKGHLVAPRRLDVDRRTGDIYVVEGPPDNRVKRFSAEGDLKQTYGRKGGRREGPYVPTDFLGVTDIATDREGGFVVAEPYVGPRRVTHVSGEGGLVNEWYGGQPFFSWKTVDPGDPTSVWFQSGNGWVVRARLDYSEGSWEVVETHHIEAKADGLSHMLDTWSQFQVRHAGGDRHLMGESIPQVFRHADGRLIPLCAGGGGSRAEVVRIGELKGIQDPLKWWQTKWKNWRTREFGHYFWSDRNADGMPQAAEITVARNLKPGDINGVEPDGSLLVTREGGLYRLPLWEWPNGVPQFGMSDPADNLEKIGDIDPDRERTIGGRFGNVDEIGTNGKWDAHADADGNHYLISNFGPNHGVSWPGNSYGGRTRLTKWNSDGVREWSVGRHATVSNWALGKTPPGHLHQPTRINGDVRGTVIITDRVSHPGMAYTKDGLYAGSLLASRFDDGLPEWVYKWDGGNRSLMGHDCAHGGAITEHGGDVYWLSPAHQGAVVYRITGWEGWSRREGPIKIPTEPSQATGKGSGLRGEYYAGDQLEGKPVATQTDRAIWFGIPLRVKRRAGARRQWGRFGPDGRIRRHANATDWTEGPVEGLSAPFSVRWRGEVEAQLTEAFRFSTYAAGGVRLWVDGEKVISDWQGSQVQNVSEPINLIAGRKYAVRLEYRTTADYPAVSLNWDSSSQDRERIPPAYLYPETRAIE